MLPIEKFDYISKREEWIWGDIIRIYLLLPILDQQC